MKVNLGSTLLAKRLLIIPDTSSSVGAIHFTISAKVDGVWSTAINDVNGTEVNIDQLHTDNFSLQLPLANFSKRLIEFRDSDLIG